VDQPHLDERLGLFVIIVLGEAVVQVVSAAAEVVPEGALWAAGLAGFGLLVCIWWLTLELGVRAVPNYRNRDLPPRVTLPAHLAMTAGIVAIAAGLGAVAEHAGGHLPEPMRWIMCGGSSLYFFVMLLVGLTGGAPRRWVLGWALPAVAVPLLVAAFGGHLPGWALVAVLVAVAFWHVLYVRIALQRVAGEGSELAESA
jgi:low temperature requirement protein LtrA